MTIGNLGCKVHDQPFVFKYFEELSTFPKYELIYCDLHQQIIRIQDNRHGTVNMEMLEAHLRVRLILSTAYSLHLLSVLFSEALTQLH